MTTGDGVTLVTGGTGFVGRVLCARLQLSGARVRVVARHARLGPWEQVVTTDLAEAGLPRSALDGVDTVFHLAAEAHARARRLTTPVTGSSPWKVPGGCCRPPARPACAASCS